MREQVEDGRRSAFGAGPIGTGSGRLRLLEPWTPDEAALDGGGRAWTDGHARWTSDRPNLAIVRAIETRLPPPTAMVVMRQLLDAWRVAERQLDATVDDSLERPRVEAQVATLRSLYQSLFAQVRNGQSEPPETGA